MGRLRAHTDRVNLRDQSVLSLIFSTQLRCTVSGLVQVIVPEPLLAVMPLYIPVPPSRVIVPVHDWLSKLAFVRIDDRDWLFPGTLWNTDAAFSIAFRFGTA
jgi:hypothetical protein